MDQSNNSNTNIIWRRDYASEQKEENQDEEIFEQSINKNNEISMKFSSDSHLNKTNSLENVFSVQLQNDFSLKLNDTTPIESISSSGSNVE